MNFYEIFEICLCLCQSIFMSAFLIYSIGQKENGINGKLLFITGVVSNMVVIELVNPKKYDVLEMFISLMIIMIVQIIYSILFLKRSAVPIIVYNVAQQAIRALSSTLGIGCAAFLFHTNYSEIMKTQNIYYVYTELIINFIWLLFGIFVCKYEKYIKDVEYDKRYVIIAMTIPFISIIVCCAIVEVSLSYSMLYFMTSVVGIIALNVIDIWLLALENSIYNARVKEQMLLSSYKQQEQDITTIMELHQETEKTRHEINRILLLVDDMMRDKRYDEVEEFIMEFMNNRNIRLKKCVYSDNNILNYIINRKIQQCHDLNISFKCFVNGQINGIADTDLYILMSNLLDNAMEAAVKTERKKIELNMYSDDKTIGIELNNSADAVELQKNKELKTTKPDSSKHGFGIENIKDIVRKYNGDINYTIRMQRIMHCSVVLCKNQE